jgi:hypothetical protein
MARYIPEAERKLKELNPDLVISDVIALYIIPAADKLGIPQVIQNPLPIDIQIYITSTLIPTKHNSCNCCGCLCSFHGITNLFAKLMPHFMEE